MMDRSSFNDIVSNLSKKDYTLIYESLINEVDKMIKNNDDICVVKEENEYCKIRFSKADLIVANAFEAVSKAVYTKGFSDVFKIDLNKAKNVSINFEDEKAQERLLNKLHDIIEKHLSATITEDQLCKVVSGLDKYINKGAKESTGATFNMKNITKFTDSLEFKYENKNIGGSSDYIRKDILYVKFKGKLHKQNIKESVMNYYDGQLDKYETLGNEDKISDIEDILKMTKENDFIVDDLHRFTYEQRNACLTRIGEFIYMDSLINSINIEKLKDEKDAAVYFQIKRYINRFSEFEDACTDILVDNKDVEFYVIDRKKPVSILNYLRSQSVYGTLPIIGDISSILGYSKDVNITEKYGIKLKLNGEVNNTAEMEAITGKKPNRNDTSSSFKYSMWRLKSLSEMTTKSEGFAEKADEKRRNTILKAISQAMLYKFMLLGLDDECHDPKVVLMNDINSLRDVGTFSEAKSLLRELAADILKNTNLIDAMLGEFVRVLESKIIKLSRNEIESAKKIHSYRRHLVIFKSILPDDALSSDVKRKLKDQMNTRNLKYTSLVDDTGLEKLSSHILMSYTYDFTIENIFANFNASSAAKINSEYINEGEIINILFYPQKYLCDKVIGRDSQYKSCMLKNSKLGKINRDNLSKSMEGILKEPQIMFPYIVEEKIYSNAVEAFVMTAIYKTLAYACIKVVLGMVDKHRKTTHINIHTQFLGNLYDPYSKIDKSNEFIHDYYKELAFVLGRKYITNSQGINTDELKFKNKNYASSIYSNVKRAYRGENLSADKKVAILAITGKEVDNSINRKNVNNNEYGINTHNSEDKISLILGELFIVEESNGEMHIEKHSNIIDSTRENVYEQPSAILDIVNEIKNIGVKDVIYLASAPYQMKYEDEDEDAMKLYYFNESIIKMMSMNGAMNIYPVYYNENSVSDSRSKGNRNSILINRDPVNLKEYCKGSSVGIIPFMQLYTGNSLNSNKGVYNSLITYSTINNMYEDILLNRTIYNGVFNDTLSHKMITNAITALHMFKFEGSQLSAKIDPLNNLTGKNGIAKKSSKEYLHRSRSGNLRFSSNSLAELRYLDKTLDLITEKK